MKQVISYSRRTDGIAWYFERFERAVERGYMDVRNPFNNKIYRVSLRPEDVAGFVFWSKDFRNLIDNWSVLDRYADDPSLLGKAPRRVYFQFTRNSRIPLLEPRTPTLDESIGQARELVELASPAHLMWRFDPIVFWREGGELKDNTGDFRDLTVQFADLGVKNCTISFATYYKKVITRMKLHGIDFHVPTAKEMVQTTRRLRDIAKASGIKIHACCNPVLLEVPGISRASCIDGNLLGRLWKSRVSVARDTGQRQECGCTKSRDIGGYGKDWECLAGCLYCYANPARNTSG